MNELCVKNSGVRRRHGRGGFSFTEILFAVMILGIGFIMVAAVFPVAIKQTQEAVDETTAADVAKGAASYLGRSGTNANFPPTAGKVLQYTGAGSSVVPFWQSMSGNLILGTDTRYAWIPFYSRGGGQSSPTAVNTTVSPYAQVTVIVVQARNTPNFTVGDLKLQTLANLEGRPALATFTDGGTTTPPTADTITFQADTGGPANISSSIAEGCYVLVADDSTLGAVVSNPIASCNGCLYRIGTTSGTSTTTWELMAGSDMKNSRYKPLGGPVHVFVVGRGYNNPSTGDTALAGPAMDVAAYSTFIQVH